MSTIDIAALTEELGAYGKFQGEGPETVHYYGRIGDGDGDMIESNSHESSSLTILVVDDEERAAFGFGPEVVSFAVQEDSQGFVTGWTLTAEEEATLRESVEEEYRQLKASALEDCLRVDVHQERGSIDVTLRAVDEELGLDMIVAHWPDCADLFEDGFLDARDSILGRFQRGRDSALLKSAIGYAESHGLLDEARKTILEGKD